MGRDDWIRTSDTLMEGQQRGRAQSDGDLANPSRTQKKRPESA